MRLSNDPALRRAQAAIELLRKQFPASPEGRLMHKVVALAITDLFPSDSKTPLRPTREDTESARTYLLGDIWHAAVAGVDPDYVRRTLTEVGVIL